MRHPLPSPRPQPLDLPGYIYLLSQAWACGQLASPASHPQSLGDKSPEGHDHHQGNDGSLQEALADAGLVWDHRGRLGTERERGRSRKGPDLGSPWSYPWWALLEVGVLRAAHSARVQRGRKEKLGSAELEVGGREHLESVTLERDKLEREAPGPLCLPLLPTLTLLVTLGGLFLWGTLPARLKWLPAWLQQDSQGQRCLWKGVLPPPPPPAPT